MEADAITTADAAYQFNFKLDRFDEFGRKMTPKEAFRELCHKFHGIYPSRVSLLGPMCFPRKHIGALYVC